MSNNEPTHRKLEVSQVPAVLRKRGITEISDNLKMGESLSISKAFTNVFRKELEERLLVTKKRNKE